MATLAASSAGPADATPTMLATEEGTVLGTPAYMSPEQAIGGQVDRRTDIFAFGCILFEMLAGQKAFDGRSAAEVRTHVLNEPPDWARLPVDLAPRFREVLEGCLEKDSKRRRRDIADVRVDLERAMVTSGVPDAAPRTAATYTRVVWTTAATAIVALAGSLLWQMRAPAVPGDSPMRLEIATPRTNNYLDFALALQSSRMFA